MPCATPTTPITRTSRRKEWASAGDEAAVTAVESGSVRMLAIASSEYTNPASVKRRCARLSSGSLAGRKQPCGTNEAATFAAAAAATVSSVILDFVLVALINPNALAHYVARHVASLTGADS